MNWPQTVLETRRKVKTEKPLVHHITNWVVTNFTANVTLAVGASPVMAHAKEEAAEMASVAQAVVLNIGTLTSYTLESMVLAGKAANEKGIPVILDPVGIGATPFRTHAIEEILNKVKTDVIRGNSSEIAFLGGYEAKIKGVDTAGEIENTKEIAKLTAQKFNTVVAMTGAIDYISDGSETVAVKNGDPLLTFVTGTGCAATSLVAAFCAVEKEKVKATATALSFYGLCAEYAAKESKGPGTFQMHLLDKIYNLEEKEILAGIKIEEV